MRTQMKKTPSKKMNSLVNTVELKDEDFFAKKPKNGEYTHEIAEANANDSEIEKELGVKEIDEELPGSESDNIPYSRNFLALKKTQRMQFWVEFFTKKDRARFQRFLNNGEEYRHHIEEILASYGLPRELYFVGLIESGYYLGARSHASAVGPWQFIRGTGKRYGLKISSELDERLDLFKSTKAAATFFRDLHNIFSSWELALSAYNAGENGMIRRIMKHNTRDYYKLSKNKQIPTETINYVPKVLAAMHVVNNAEKYGFILPKKKFRLFDLTELRAIKRNTSLKAVAERLSIDLKLLRKLNPELKQNSTPRFVSGNYMLRVPTSKYSYRLENLAAPIASLPLLDKPESRKEMNRRTAAIISKKVTSRLANSKKITSPKVKITKSPIIYKVRSGDNLTDLARIFNLKVSKIKTVNNLKRGKIQIGQRIVLPDTQKGIYVVKRGDHLTHVARSFNSPVEALVKLNALKKRSIYPGQKIIVNID